MNGVEYMCVAVPGKVIQINGNIAKVDIMNNVTEVNIALVDAKMDDYVLIHAGCAIEVLEEETAKEIISLFEELEGEALNENSRTS